MISTMLKTLTESQIVMCKIKFTMKCGISQNQLICAIRGRIESSFCGPDLYGSLHKLLLFIVFFFMREAFLLCFTLKLFLTGTFSFMLKMGFLVFAHNV